ncbi:hypothetical protein K8R78_03020 [bacterium]|nr:hypothetical protein [bacterium]
MEILSLIFSIIGAVGVVFIGVSLLLARRQHRFSRTYEVYERLDSKEAREARQYTRHNWSGNISELGKMKLYEQLVHRHINDMDVVGSLITDKLVDFKLVSRVFGAMVVSSWDKCSKYVEKQRRNRFKYFACHFEAAAKLLKKKGIKVFDSYSKKHRLNIPE